MKCTCKRISVYFIVVAAYFFEAEGLDVATTVPPNIKYILDKTNITNVKQLLNATRRIIGGKEAGTSRPYMVYLKLPVSSAKYAQYRSWMCGGVIVHEEYILTSAACIEDAQHFYVVSGTYKHDQRDDRNNNPCIKNGAKKAVWKCIPRNYIFDGHENDNIRWMNNDIAVVKVEDEFDFTRRIRGCDFIPRPVCYNNQSSRLEEPGTDAFIAGWGSTLKYNEQDAVSQNLLESHVKIISKARCKKRWGSRYHHIIDNYMICTKDVIPDMTEICQEKYVECTDIMYSEESGEERRRALALDSGGFCENDHGGPLVVGSGTSEVVVGVISACLVHERTGRCHGPFLYTSVYRNKNLISCAIYKETATDCDKLFRSSITHVEQEMSWKDHPDGPAKSEIKAMRRKQEKEQNGVTQTTRSEDVTDAAADTQTLMI